MLLTTHYMFEADELCDRIAVIRAGEIVAEGTPQQLKGLVSAGSVVEIETYGVEDAATAELGALAGVRSVAVEERGQMQVLILRCDTGAEVAQAALGRLDGVRVGRVGIREPTLEDAYVELVSRTVRQALRQQLVCYRLQLKVISTSWFDGALAIFFPLMFATATLLVYRVQDDPEAMQFAGLGAAIMGMWTCQGVIASSLLARERWAGTLELVVAAPTPLGRVLVPTTLALSTIGLYTVVAAILWERWVFGLELRIESWPLFVLSVLAAAFTLAQFGFFLAVTVVRYRTAWSLGAALEYPGGCCAGSSCPSPPSRTGCTRCPGRSRPRGRWTRSGPPRPATPPGVTSPSASRSARRTPCSRRTSGAGWSTPPAGRRRWRSHEAAPVTSLRILLVGGLMSYRAMFNWLSPWILVPSMIVSPICQILLFSYIGRSAGVGDDEFYVIGNALNYAAIPCLFAMGATIEGEREGRTLSVVLTTPAARIPLFLGRAVPVIVNGWAVALVGILFGLLVLDVDVPARAWPSLLLVVAVASASCTGLGLAMGAVALRVRESAVLGNVLFCVLLVFSGVNIAIDDLPSWMAAVSPWLPLTHAIEAARGLANGATLGDVGGLVVHELAVGALYAVGGLLLLRWLEQQSRAHATLERV